MEAQHKDEDQYAGIAHEYKASKMLPFRTESEEVRAPRPGPIPPITANRSAGPHSGDAHPFRRSGQLSAVATDAPVASTPPRRREPGR